MYDVSGCAFRAFLTGPGDAEHEAVPYLYIVGGELRSPWDEWDVEHVLVPKGHTLIPELYAEVKITSRYSWFVIRGSMKTKWSGLPPAQRKDDKLFGDIFIKLRSWNMRDQGRSTTA